MTDITCTRRIQFCAGHRVLGHESKCANLHGHNYVALVHARADGLDELGRVIDFSVLKERVGGWIDRHWDHAFLVFDQDAELLAAFERVEHQKPPFVCPFNPTAENMAAYLLRRVAPEALRDTGVRIVRVDLWETENCKATARLDA